MKKFFIALLAVALVGAFTVPAMAEWNFYGMVSLGIVYESPDNAYTNDPGPMTNGGAAASDDELSLPVSLYTPTTWIGARVKGGNVGGRFELREGNIQGAYGFDKIYGTWNFGSGTLLVGKNNELIDYFISGTIYGNNPMFGSGAFFAGGSPMVAVTFGGLQVALVQTTTYTPGSLSAAYNDTDVRLPGLQAAYTWAQGPFLLRPAAGIQTFSVNGPGVPGLDVTSWVIELAFTYTPGVWYVKTAAYYACNGGGIGGLGWFGTGAAVGNGATTLYDIYSWGGLINAGFVINPMIKVEAGYGYWNILDSSATTNDDPTQFYYIQAPITLAKGVFIVPEIGVRDKMTSNAGVNQGKKVYGGTKFQIIF
jgi:hypothetical protein